MIEYPATPPNPGPSCYRHEGRETYIRCSRCERAICPDCMVSAAVGFHCPDCVREGAKSIRQPKTAFGGAPASGSHVTFGIIGLCVAVFLMQQVLGEEFTGRFQLLSWDFDRSGLIGVSHGQYYRLITATVLHASVIHLALNMYALYLLALPWRPTWARCATSRCMCWLDLADRPCRTPISSPGARRWALRVPSWACWAPRSW